MQGTDGGKAMITRHYERLCAYGLIAPLAVFLVMTFVIPLSFIVGRSVLDQELSHTLPTVNTVLSQWDGRGSPPPAAADALLTDLATADLQDLAALSRRLNPEMPGIRSMIATAKRGVAEDPATTLQDPRWQEPAVWQTLKRATGPVNDYFLLKSLDLKRDFESGIESTQYDGLYRGIMLRTFTMALCVTVLCIVLAYPLCAFLARQPARRRNMLLLFVLLPFWTSALVRNMSWMIILQDRGVINQLLAALGVIDSPLSMMYNRIAVIIAMTHVVLPYMIFPLLAAMMAFDRRLLMASASLGARPLMSFYRVYLPQILPGLSAGALIIFIVALGFYITPALLGGPNDQLVSFYIAQFTTATLNWGMAAALSTLLLLFTAVLYLYYFRVARAAKDVSR